MKIAKALKRITKLKGEIAELSKRMSECNIAMEDNEFVEDFGDLEMRQGILVTELIKLKCAVMKANVDSGMYEKILEMAEYKSGIQILKAITIKVGKESNYGEKVTTWRSQMDVKDRNKGVEEIETMIEKLRDELDAFNANTDIEI